MSVPAANALSPAPVMRIALIERSSFALLQISAKRSYIANVSAFLACGRLKVTYATPSRTSCSSSSMVFLTTRVVQPQVYRSASGAQPKRRRPRFASSAETVGDPNVDEVRLAAREGLAHRG